LWSVKITIDKTEKTKSYDIESYLLGDVSYFSLHNSTKANTLASLKPHLEKSIIEELYIFTKDQWKNSSDRILKEIKNKFEGEIVVRSSTGLEDSHNSSFAGFFHSELNVDSQNYQSIEKAVSNVIDSYVKHKKTSSRDQVLVQSQTKDVVYSGVVFTRNIQSNGPYYLINYDQSSSTDSVTSGEVGNKIEIINNIEIDNLPFPWKSLIESVREIENSLHNIALDIEFAIKESGQVVIFQVRTIAALQKYKNIPEKIIYAAVKDLIYQYNNFSQSSLIKSHYTLSDMSFWNPAEIIGDRSGNLAYSIYRYLILERPWNEGLISLGYKKVDRDLVVRIGNKAYIEVETSFASLLPENLDSTINKKLILFYLNKLKQSPELHDKIEFEVVHNCFTPVTEIQLKELRGVLSEIEIQIFKNSLKKITQHIFDNYNDIRETDLRSLALLKSKREKLLVDLNDKTSIHQRTEIILELLDDAKELGTPQFARMARLAFIGNQYLKGLVKRGVIREEARELFVLNIDTIASDLSNDFNRVMSENLSIEAFNNTYGHLRPGTYDINKLPYSKDFRYFSRDSFLNKKDNIIEKRKDDRKNLEDKIDKFLYDFDISISANNLLLFIEETTKFRESFKFEFTKNLSQSLELLADIGKELGFERNKVAHLSIESLKGVSHSSGISEIIDLWSSIIEGKKSNDHIFKYVALPSLIFNKDDFKIIKSHTVQPNFITNSLVRGDLVALDDVEIKDYDSLTGKIVLLEKADPGYDWIFSKEINGLITRFGGAASHMAIRSAEFGIPAAIGCGEIIFTELKEKQLVELDCMNKKIIVIR